MKNETYQWLNGSNINRWKLQTRVFQFRSLKFRSSMIGFWRFSSSHFFNLSFFIFDICHFVHFPLFHWFHFWCFIFQTEDWGARGRHQSGALPYAAHRWSARNPESRDRYEWAQTGYIARIQGYIEGTYAVGTWGVHRADIEVLGDT